MRKKHKKGSSPTRNPFKLRLRIGQRIFSWAATLTLNRHLRSGRSASQRRIRFEKRTRVVRSFGKERSGSAFLREFLLSFRLFFGMLFSQVRFGNQLGFGRPKFTAKRTHKDTSRTLTRRKRSRTRLCRRNRGRRGR